MKAEVGELYYLTEEAKIAVAIARVQHTTGNWAEVE